jgi:hypothetical protein
MIPKEKKRAATFMTLFSFGLLIIGATIGAYWVLTYAPK